MAHTDTLGTKAHPYDEDPRSTTGSCTCGLAMNHRSHQSLLWRLLNWGKDWR